MNHLNKFRLLAPLMMVLPLWGSGCSGLSARPYPEKNRYTLVIELPSDSVARTISAGVRVQPVCMAQPFAGTSFVYKTGPSKLTVDYYNEFISPPERLIAGQLEASLARLGPFESVSNSASLAPYGYLLETTVTGFYVDCSETGKSASVFEVKFFLIDDRDTRCRTVFQKSYVIREVLAQRTPDSMVIGWEHGMAATFARLAADLREMPR